MKELIEVAEASMLMVALRVLDQKDKATAQDIANQEAVALINELIERITLQLSNSQEDQQAMVDAINKAF